MIILSIETSCDDTGVALVEKKNGNLKIIASTLSSQDKIHKKWGGVHPSEAKREHQKNLVPSLQRTLLRADFLKKGETPRHKEIREILSRETVMLKKTETFFKKYKIKKKIDAIAVTVGPGLEPCLWVGVNFARALSSCLDIPIIPVNHIKAHILFFLLQEKKIKFPVIALIASGGHTELVLMKSLSSYTLVGKTRDDAAGECFDKAARILGLGYPGGPAIAAKATQFSSSDNQFSIKLPRPMMHSKDYGFSFSGLKTAVLYDFLSREKKKQKNEKYIREMSYKVEEAITDILVFKLKKAIKEFKAKTVVLGGGVTANKTLRKKTEKIKKDFPKIDIFIPSGRLAMDNAEMIGIAASIDKKRKKQEKVRANANLKIYDKIT